MGAICLGKHLCLNQFIDIVRRHAKVEFFGNLSKPGQCVPGFGGKMGG